MYTIQLLVALAWIFMEIIRVLNDKGIFEALTNHVDSEYHYIVDTFATNVNDINYIRRMQLLVLQRLRITALLL